MRRKLILALSTVVIAVIVVSVLLVYQPWEKPESIDPIVSNDWLADNLGKEDLVILDVRTEGYNVSHIPGAIHSTPFFNWVINPPDPAFFPWLELPSDEDLFNVLGAHGITKDSWVVVVGTTSGPFPFGLYNNADPTRVAMTLIYAGVENVAILDGGMEAWESAGYTVTTKVPADITPVTYDGQVKESMFVSTEYVESKIGEATIVDARDEIVYNGTITEPWGPTPGHIPTAKNLPTPELWNVVWDDSGTLVVSATYKDVSTLKEMASDVVGKDLCNGEIIVYCGVGGYASTVFFVLSEVLGYCNVMVYDGSFQVWDSLGLTVET